MHACSMYPFSSGELCEIVLTLRECVCPFCSVAYTIIPAYAQEQIIISNDMHSINSIWSITKATTTTTMTEKNSSGCNEYKANSVIRSSISLRDRRSCHPFRNAMFAHFVEQNPFFPAAARFHFDLCSYAIGQLRLSRKYSKSKEDLYHTCNGMAWSGGQPCARTHARTTHLSIKLLYYIIMI